MNHFCRVHEIVAQQRLNRADELLPIAHQRARITELEAALKDLLRAGDSLRLPKAQENIWHSAALIADKVLAGEGGDA